MIVDLNFRNNTLVDSEGNLTSGQLLRNSIATYVDGSGIRQEVAINTPRFTAEGLLIEGTAKNFFDNAGDLGAEAPATQSITLPADTYTLWIEGTGSVEYDGNTATEGSPSTFVIASETTDDCTVTGSVERVQLEDSPYKTSFMPTNGGAATRATESGAAGVSGFSWTMESAVTSALADAGTLIIKTTMLQDYDAFSRSSNQGLSSVRDNATSILYFSNMDGHIRTYDGTLWRGLEVDWSENDTMSSLVRWDKDLDGGAGYLHILAKLNTTWNLNTGNEAPFDGSFTLGTLFWLCYGNEVPVKISRIVMYDEYLSDEQIQDEIWSGGAKKGLMRLGMQIK